MVGFKAAVIAVFAASLVGLVASIPDAMAADMVATKCPASKAYVPKWGCLLKTVISQAKKNCLALKPPQKDFRECLCEDSGQVGACGN